jgi:hypothetical protein
MQVCLNVTTVVNAIGLPKMPVALSYRIEALGLHYCTSSLARIAKVFEHHCKLEGHNRMN